jgi:putative ABC transport system substrate-binding protein
MPVIGFLGSTTPGPSANMAAFHHGLAEVGYVDGRNVSIEYRWAEGQYERLPGFAADLIDRKVDVIAAQSTVSARAAKNATSVIPIAFIAGDPVGAGLVASLARPGGNLTGVSIITEELTPKRLELLSELVPNAKTIALVVNPNNPNHERQARNAQDAARTMRFQFHVVKAGSESNIDAAFTTIEQQHASAVLIFADPFLDSRRDQLVALAARHAVPVSYSLREFTEAGGLISYGPSFTTAFREAGIYVGKILNGAKPSEMPVQQPTKVELVINLKTAKALGLPVPQSLLARADEVIE